MRVRVALAAAVILGAMQAPPASADHTGTCVGVGSVKTSSPSSTSGGGGTLSGSLAGGCAPPLHGVDVIPLTLNPCGGLSVGSGSTPDGRTYSYVQSGSFVAISGEINGVMYLTDDPTVPGTCTTGTSDFLAVVKHTFS